MALSQAQKDLVQALRDHYYKAKTGINDEAASWPQDAAGTPYRSDATTPADPTGADPGAADLAGGYKSKIGSVAQKAQDDVNEMLDLIVELGGA